MWRAQWAAPCCARQSAFSVHTHTHTHVPLRSIQHHNPQQYTTALSSRCQIAIHRSLSVGLLTSTPEIFERLAKSVGTGASILGGESNLPRFLKWGVEGMIISIAFSANFLQLNRQCQIWGLISHPPLGMPLQIHSVSVVLCCRGRQPVVLSSPLPGHCFRDAVAATVTMTVPPRSNSVELVTNLIRLASTDCVVSPL